LYEKSPNSAYKYDIATALVNLSIAQQGDKNFTAAINNLIESKEILLSLSLTGDQRMISSLVKAYENLFFAYTASGNFDAGFEAGTSALELVKKHHHISNAFFSDELGEVSKRIEETLHQYPPR
jgi:hypothetical protein